MKLEIPSSWNINNRIVKEPKSESFARWADHCPKNKKRNFRLNPKKDNVIRVLTNPEGNDLIKEFDYTHNIVTDDGSNSSTYEVELYNATDAATIHQFTQANGGANVHLDSGDITVAVTGDDKLCWRYKTNDSTPVSDVSMVVSFEYEYDDLF